MRLFTAVMTCLHESVSLIYDGKLYKVEGDNQRFSIDREHWM